MTTEAQPSSLATYRPGLALFAAIASAWVFVLVALGAFTTTINAGMAFADWPLSNGSLNPSGWLTHINMFAEHSHRLSATIMGLLTIVLAVWLRRVGERPWLVKLGYFAVGLVILQGVAGGLRVLLDSIQVEAVATSLGQLIAMLHACLAQAMACTLIAIACSLSRPWIRGGHAVQDRVRLVGKLCCGLFFLQLAVAAVLRHSFAGLAIPTFPYSTPEGALLPSAWDFRVAIHFTHRVLACCLAVGVVTFASLIWIDRGSSLTLRCGASVLVSLLAFQIMRGAFFSWSHRAVALTTTHVVVGAATLVTAFSLSWLAHRDSFEARSSP